MSYTPGFRCPSTPLSPLQSSALFPNAATSCRRARSPPPLRQFPANLPANLPPHLCLQHGDQDHGINDDKTHVWAARFAPAAATAVGPSVVATAGGECVCIIDCDVVRVTHKYTHPGEDFYALDWLVHGGDGDESSAAAVVIAAGGAQTDIKLIDVNQRTCYAQLTGHAECITTIRFVPGLAGDFGRLACKKKKCVCLLGLSGLCSCSSVAGLLLVPSSLLSELTCRYSSCR